MQSPARGPNLGLVNAIPLPGQDISGENKQLQNYSLGVPRLKAKLFRQCENQVQFEKRLSVSQKAAAALNYNRRTNLLAGSAALSLLCRVSSCIDLICACCHVQCIG